MCVTSSPAGNLLLVVIVFYKAWGGSQLDLFLSLT
jgi:hypothetical protein